MTINICYKFGQWPHFNCWYNTFKSVTNFNTLKEWQKCRAILQHFQKCWKSVGIEHFQNVGTTIVSPFYLLDSVGKVLGSNTLKMLEQLSLKKIWLNFTRFWLKFHQIPGLYTTHSFLVNFSRISWWMYVIMYFIQYNTYLITTDHILSLLYTLTTPVLTQHMT